MGLYKDINTAYKWVIEIERFINSDKREIIYMDFSNVKGLKEFKLEDLISMTEKKDANLHREIRRFINKRFEP